MNAPKPFPPPLHAKVRHLNIVLHQIHQISRSREPVLHRIIALHPYRQPTGAHSMRSQTTIKALSLCSESVRSSPRPTYTGVVRQRPRRVRHQAQRTEVRIEPRHGARVEILLSAIGLIESRLAVLRLCRRLLRGLVRLSFDVQFGDLEEKMAHLVELVRTFGDGAAGFDAEDEVGEGVEVGGIAVEDHVAEDDDEGGEGCLEDSPSAM